MVSDTEVTGQDLSKIPNNDYWEKLYSMYNISENKNEIRRFISSKSTNFQELLLEIPHLIHYNFKNLGITLKLTKDFKEYQMLKIAIKTNLSPEEAIAKLDEVEEIIFNSNSYELLSSLMISVDFK